jgi:multiple sugar transport system permease protein
MVLIGLFVLAPVVYAVWLSMTNKRLTGFGARTPKFIGAENYTRLLGSADFINSMGRTAQFIFFSAIVGQFLLGMLAAVLLTKSSVRGKGLIGGAILLPMVVPEVVASLAWVATGVSDGVDHRGQHLARHRIRHDHVSGRHRGGFR